VLTPQLGELGIAQRADLDVSDPDIAGGRAWTAVSSSPYWRVRSLADTTGAAAPFGDLGASTIEGPPLVPIGAWASVA
jgi:hypothetical protein